MADPFIADEPSASPALPAYSSLCTTTGPGQYVLTVTYDSMAAVHAASAFIVQNSEVANEPA